MSQQRRDTRLVVVCAKVAPAEKAMLVATASMTGDSLSQLSRTLLVRGAKERLRGLAEETPTPAGAMTP